MTDWLIIVILCVISLQLRRVNSFLKDIVVIPPDEPVQQPTAKEPFSWKGKK